MTRKEAIEVLIVKAGYGKFVKDIINQIFDEYQETILTIAEVDNKKIKKLEERIKDLETDKTCVGCKHWVYDGYGLGDKTCKINKNCKRAHKDRYDQRANS